MVVIEFRIRVVEKEAKVILERVRSLKGVLEAGEDVGSGIIVVKVEAEDLDSGKREQYLKAIRGMDGVVEARVMIPNELVRRGTPWVSAITYLVYPILWILPSTPVLLGWQSLGFLAVVPSVEVPPYVVPLALGLLIALQGLAIYANYLRVRDGGCQDSEKTLVLITKGPYSLIRHPSTLGGLALLLLLPVILGWLIRYTVLAVLGQFLVLTIVSTYQVPKEEKFSLRKWGEAYEAYRRTVPMFNIILGLWRLTRRRRS